MTEDKNKTLLAALTGAKKGGGGQAVEADDTLRSKAYARVLDVISEGEIEGLANGAKSIYLDGTRLQNDDGEFNFEGVQVEFRAGTQGQEHIAGFPSVENEVSIGVEIKADTPVTRTITNPNVDAVRVKILIPQLSEQNKDTGDLNGTSVKIAIEVQGTGGSFTRVVEEEITGKTMSRYERSWRVPLSGAAPWQVRAVRLSPDSGSSALMNQTWLSSLTEIVDAKLSYPNTALVGLRVDASQFSSVPTRAYHMKLLRIRVPSNYNPTTRTYSGSWDGSFKIAWSNNPAWCFYDLLTSARYGLGQNIPEDYIDKWGLYQIGRYCDEMVPNGRGGSEPRFTLNCYLQTREDAYKLLNDMASAFRGMLYWAGGSIVATQDAPGDPSYIFTNANVVEGSFSYSGVSVKQRHTVALVTWNDLSDMGRQKVEYVEDAEGVAHYGVVQTEVAAFGCTSQAQAHRVGRWILASEMSETETVSFTTGMEGVIARPGQLIKVRDNYRHGTRLGGRVLGGTTHQVTLDAPVTLTGSGPYRLSILQPGGTVHESNVSTGAGGPATVLNLSTPMADAPARGTTWILSIPGDEGAAKTYRVISVSEREAGVTYDVVALEHNPQKYEAIDLGTRLENGYLPPGTGTGGGGNNPNGLPPPKNPKVTVTPYSEGSTQKFRLSFSWEPGGQEVQWEVEHQREGQNPERVENLNTALFEIADAQQGYWVFSVRAVSTGGQRSAWVRAPAAFVGTRNIDDAFLFFNVIPGFLKNRVIWEYNAALLPSLRTVEVWAYKPASETSPVLVGTVAAPATEWVHHDLVAGEIWNYRVRAIDQYGNISRFFPEDGLNAAADMDVTYLINSIQDSIVNSEFYQELGSRIEAIGDTDFAALESEISRIVRDQERSGELLLRSVLVDETIRDETADTEARLLQTMGILQDGLALEAYSREALAVRVQDTEAALVSESTARADGDAALATQMTALQAQVNDEVTAMILSESEARATADAALATQIDGLQATIEDEVSAQIVTEAQARADADGALATQVTQVSARLDNAGGAGVTVEQKFTAQGDSLTNLGGKYTVKIDNNGYVSGFGLASEPNNGTPYSSFNIRADRFAIGSPGQPSITPFVVYTTPTTVGGQPVNPGVYINGDLLVNGTVNANKIDSRGLQIKDTYGNVILGSGVNLNWSYLSGQPTGIYNSNISIGSNGALSGAGGGQVTLTGMGAGQLALQNQVDIGSSTSQVRFWNGSSYQAMRTSDFVNSLTKINSSNISTFMSSAAIGNAYIGNAAVSTLTIAGNAVTVPGFVTGSSTIWGIGNTNYQDVLQGTVSMDVAGWILASCSMKQDFPSASGWWRVQLYINNQLVFSTWGGHPNDSPTVVGALWVPAGNYPVTVKWAADSSVAVMGRTLWFMGAKR